MLTYYHVTIVSNNGTTSLDPTTGIIDNRREQDFGVALSTLTDLNHSIAKTAANIRWKKLMEAVESLASPEVLDIVMTGGDLNTPPTQVEFTVGFRDTSYLVTPDELNPGQFLYNDACIKRLVARSMTYSQTENQGLYNPTLDPKPAGSGGPIGPIAMYVTATALVPNVTTAETYITIVSVPYMNC